MNHGKPTGSYQRHRSAFTLVELLMVIALMVLLIGFTIGSVGSMGQARRLTTGGNMTVDLINDARQLAMARNTMTMVALVTGTTQADPEPGRLLTTLIYSPDTATNGGWSQIDQWRRLPEGINIYIKKAADPDPYITNETSGESLFKDVLALTTKPTLKRNGVNLQYSAAVFLPDGRAHTTTTKAQLATLKQSTAADPTSNTYKIIVNSATGIPIIRRP